jgi:biopolymer transport protein ExbD
MRQDSGIVLPLVALLDVIFFMLFYFMAAGSLSAPEAELPAAISADRKGPGSGTSDFTSQVLYVELDKGMPRFRLGQRAVATRADLEGILSELPKAPGIIVKASDDVTVENVAAALQAARVSGFSKISYVAGQ